MWGIPLATSVVNIAGTAALVVLMRRRVGRLGARAIAAAFARTTVASALAAAAGFGAWYGLDAALGRSLGAQALAVGGALAVSAVVFVAAARILRIRELDAVLSLVRRPGGTE